MEISLPSLAHGSLNAVVTLIEEMVTMMMMKTASHQGR